MARTTVRHGAPAVSRPAATGRGTMAIPTTPNRRSGQRAWSRSRPGLRHDQPRRAPRLLDEEAQRQNGAPRPILHPAVQQAARRRLARSRDDGMAEGDADKPRAAGLHRQGDPNDRATGRPRRKRDGMATPDHPAAKGRQPHAEGDREEVSRLEGADDGGGIARLPHGPGTGRPDRRDRVRRHQEQVHSPIRQRQRDDGHGEAQAKRSRGWQARNTRKAASRRNPAPPSGERPSPRAQLEPQRLEADPPGKTDLPAPGQRRRQGGGRDPPKADTDGVP